MYKINLEKARGSIAKKSLKEFDNIVSQKVLGASNHINMIGDIIEQIALDSNSIKEMKERIIEVTNYFIYTRGEASQAIKNAICIMTNKLDTYNGDIQEVVKKIIKDKNDYHIKSKYNIDLAVKYSVKLCENFKTILVYDYSSSVDMMLKSLKKPITVFIAESRAINGGVGFIKSCILLGHKIHFIPDVALMYYIKKCDAVFMGAETIYPDGTGFNTIGSDIVALICSQFDIPLYFITTLIKLDFRMLKGDIKQLVINDMSSKFKELIGNENNNINFDCPELVGVPMIHIKGFITELGIIPSGQLYSVSMKYKKILEGDDYNV